MVGGKTNENPQEVYFVIIGSIHCAGFALENRSYISPIPLDQCKGKNQGKTIF